VTCRLRSSAAGPLMPSCVKRSGPETENLFLSSAAEIEIFSSGVPARRAGHFSSVTRGTRDGFGGTMVWPRRRANS